MPGNLNLNYKGSEQVYFELISLHSANWQTRALSITLCHKIILGLKNPFCNPNSQDALTLSLITN